MFYHRELQDRLYLALEKHGFRNKELADILGITVQLFYRYRKNHRELPQKHFETLDLVLNTLLIPREFTFAQFEKSIDSCYSFANAFELVEAVKTSFCWKFLKINDVLYIQYGKTEDKSKTHRVTPETKLVELYTEINPDFDFMSRSQLLDDSRYWHLLIGDEDL